VHRRDVLRSILLASGTALAGAPDTAWPIVRPRTRVGVIGAGIVGASIAMHLARAGAAVTVFERSAPASGATRNSFAWIDPWTEDAHYMKLRLRSIAAWKALDRALGLGVVWGGYIDWATSAAEVDDLERLAAMLRGTPFAVERLDAERFRALSPAVEPGAFAAAFHSRIDGHANPVAVTERWLRVARQHGAGLEMPAKVTGLATDHGRVSGVVTAAGVTPVDHLVIAAGVDTPAILAHLDEHLTLRHAPGILAHSAPTGVVTRLVYDGADGLEFKQMADGSIVGTDSEQVPDLPVHAGIRAAPIDFPDETLRRAHGERILKKLAAVMPAARGVPLERLTLGFRVLPMDGLPIVGALPRIANAYVVATHSGVTLSALLGSLVAREVLTSYRDPMLLPYRPARALGAIV
jgi:glycine/D-amino acid oxidase-like deaminating enzyme